MLQHLIMTFVAPPLLLLGLPAAVLRGLLRPRFVHWAFTRLARPAARRRCSSTWWSPCSHWPAARRPRACATSRCTSACTPCCSRTAVLMWFPVLNRLPEYPSIGDPGRMVYLFLQSVIPTVPASFLTFGDSPLYHFYAKLPRIWGISLIEDQQLAGGIMKVVGGGLLWVIIAVMFFRWYSRTERETHGDVLTWADVERELEQHPRPGLT